MGNFCCNESRPKADEHDAPITQDDIAASRDKLFTALSQCQQHIVPLLEGMDVQQKQAFLDSLMAFEKSYPGGIVGYTSRAQTLLAASKEGVNPFEGFGVTPPQANAAVRFPEFGDEYAQFETIGVQQLAATGFILVAGGLGERLGYNGIKVELSIEKTTGQCYLQYYIETILAYQARARVEAKDDSIVLPLAIMVSGDTDVLTRKLLDENKNFGMSEGQLTLIKQDLVPALEDNDAKIATKDGDVIMKPHGHGDVHLLMHTSGTAAAWVKQGVKFVTFFQDTNGLVFRSVVAALGVSADRKLACNFVTVPRKPGEAVGAICELSNADKKMTINVEYNQMDALMSGPEPMVKDADGKDTGFSVFPGNINVFILDAKIYDEILTQSSGLVSEFINPKYVPDSNRTKFLKPTRVECMMQDFAKLAPTELHASGRIGLSQFPKWRSFSAVKNALETGAAKAAKGLDSETAISGETDFYSYTRKVLSDVVTISDSKSATSAKLAGIDVPIGARIVVDPRLAVTNADLISVFQPAQEGSVSVTSSSSMVLKAAADSLVVKNLTLAGDLVIKAAVGAKVTVDGLTVSNKGSALQDTLEAALKDPSSDIFGYKMVKTEEDVYVFDTPGDYVLSDGNKADFLQKAPTAAV